MTEPVSLETLKVHLRLEDDDGSEDTYISGLIVAARRSCERYTGRQIANTTRSFALDAFPFLPLEWADPAWQQLELGIIVLPEGNVTSITSIVYQDEVGTHTLDAGTYGTDLVTTPARIYPIVSWPTTLVQPGAVLVTYVESALSADDLAVLVQAMLLIIGNWYRNREGVQVDARGVPAQIPQSAGWLLDSIREAI